LLPPAARVLVHGAVVVGVVVVAYPRGPGGMAAWPGHLPPADRLLLARIDVADGRRAPPCGDAGRRVVSGPALPLGVIPGIAVLHGRPLSTRRPSRHRVIRRAYPTAPGVAGPGVVASRAMAHRRGGSPVLIDVAGG